MADIYRDWVLYNVGKAIKNGQDYQFDWTMLPEYNQLLEQYQQEILKWDFWRKWQTSSYEWNVNYELEPTALARWEWRSRDGTVYHIYSFYLKQNSSYQYFSPVVVHIYKQSWWQFTWNCTISSWEGRRRSSASLTDGQYYWVDTNYWVRAKYDWDKNIIIKWWWEWDCIQSKNRIWWVWNEVDGSWTHRNSTTYYTDVNTIKQYWIDDCWISDSELVSSTNYVQSLSWNYRSWTGRTWTLILK